MARKKKYFNYEPYLKSLADSISKEYKVKPFPKVKLSNRNQGDGCVFVKTGYYDPTDKVIVLFVHNRHPKDVLRSFAHEMIHHHQNIEGRLTPDAYSGQEIIGDDKLKKLEEEAYLKGNISFRSWTERMEKNIDSEPTEHMRKHIKLNEVQMRKLIKFNN